MYQSIKQIMSSPEMVKTIKQSIYIYCFDKVRIIMSSQIIIFELIVVHIK